MSNIDLFFNPKNIAVIGASRTPGKIGYNILENLKGTFKGQIYPVNPLATEIANIQTFPSVESIPDQVDTAIIAVKAELVPEILQSCIKKKIKAILLLSTGFEGVENKERLEELKKLLKGKDMLLLGPSALGTFQPKVIDTLFFTKERLKRPSEGQIGLITQSGTIGSSIIDRMGSEGIGISKFIAYGGGVGLNETSLLDHFGRDLSTRAIALCIEYISNVPDFIKTASKVAKIKPVVVLKAGKTQKGSEAVSAHTGVPPGPAEAYSAAFRQAGLLEAKTLEELVDFTKALASQPPVPGNSVAIITDSGGIGILATDSATQAGFEVPEISKEATKSLKNTLPEGAKISNPLDLTLAANSEWFQKAIEAASKDKSINAIVVIAQLQSPSIEESIVDVLRDAKIYGKPIVVCANKSDYSLKLTRRMESFGIPVYSTPERAVRALAALREYGAMTGAKPKVEEKKEEQKKPAKKITTKKSKPSISRHAKKKKKR